MKSKRRKISVDKINHIEIHLFQSFQNQFFHQCGTTINNINIQ